MNFRRPKRWTSLTAICALVVGSTTVVALSVAAPAAAATPAITLSKDAPSAVLAGQPARFTLTAANPGSNPSAAPEYNTSFRDVLPIGVSYQPGSATPASIGDPIIVTNGVTGQQTLIWRDAFDLQIGATSAISFNGALDPVQLPVASAIDNTASAYASTAPRTVPSFSATGAPVADVNVQSATSNATTTAITALDITKSEPSPESELLRGVHDQKTTYTLTVRETAEDNTDSVLVTDYVPADQEFLGCGGVDHTTGATAEYPTAPALSAGGTLNAGCPTPVSVDTVSNPPANGSVSYPPGVYTKVVWDLGTMTPGDVRTIKYLAGIPLNANALFGPGAPAPGSGDQTANLDNNVGPSTRQVGSAAASINYAHASGHYAGAVASGDGSVVSDTNHQVTINDLRIYKGVAPAEFTGGGIATYTLHIDSGEYTDNSAITITDILPNGTCPLNETGNYVDPADTNRAECDGGAGDGPVGSSFDSVTQNPDGTFTVVFAPIAVAKDGTATITYKARMRTAYTDGSLAGNPPSTGDSFTNHAVEVATSTPVPATGVSGDVSVTDPTSATQTTSFGSIAKLIGAREVPMTCGTATYGKTDPLFLKGDRVCFEVTVPFSTSNQTRNPVVTDFLPANLSYEAGSVTIGPGNTVPGGEIQFDETAAAATGQLTWTLGASQPSGGLEVAAGEVFQARFSAIVTAAAVGPPPDKPGNIVKLRSENSAADAESLRDGVDFSVAAPPPVAITKGVANVNGVPGLDNPADTDHIAVAEGDSVTYRIDLTNNGTAATGNDVDVSNVRVWDALAPGIRCAQVTAITAAGACTDPGDGGQPSFAGNGSLSAIVWNSAAALAPAATRTLGYTVTIPAGTSVSTDLTDTASVRSYDAATDLGGSITYYPRSNVDTTVPAGTQDAPIASDPSDVYVPDVTVAKGVQSPADGTVNTGGESTPAASTNATIGEVVACTLSATVPHGSTVYQATLTDPVPANLALISAVASYQPDAASVTTAALPAGVVFDPATASVTWPATYDNISGTDQRFSIVITARVTKAAGNTNGLTVPNTATFHSTTTAGGATNVPDRSVTATVVLVEPAPTLGKINDAPAGGVSGNQTVTYTLTAGNTAGRAILHDAWVIDCLPTGLTFADYGTPLPAGVSTLAATAGDGTNGCATNTTRLAYDLGDLAGGASKVLTYTATVDPTASGQQSYVNSAAISGNSLSGTRTDPTADGDVNGRLYSTPAISTVAAAGATAAKSVSPTQAPVGATVTYQASASLPAGINFYNLSLIDQLPAGIDVSSLVETGVTCINSDDAAACGITSATALSNSAGPGATTTIGWLFGDTAAAAHPRTVTVTYTATVADVLAAAHGVALSNSVHVAWDTAATATPTSAGATYGKTSGNRNAPLTVLEPQLSITKGVSTATPEPGGAFTYSVTVKNSAAADASTAYNVTVRDVVPLGVIVDASSLVAQSGSITGVDSTRGGGTITWSIPASIATGASATALTYQAVLAPSNTLTAAGLTNTAGVTGYDSLPAGGRHYTGPSTTKTVTPRIPKVSTVKSTPSGTLAYLGQSFPWAITVTNSGAGKAFAVGTTDTLPANWTYDGGSAQVTVNGGTTTQLEPVVNTAAGIQTLTWTGLGALPAGTVATIAFSATPGLGVPTAPGIGLSVNQTNTATSTSQDATGATGNSAGPYSNGPGAASAQLASADLVMAKAVGTVPVAGAAGSWMLTVTNNGPDLARGPFTVTDDFADSPPAGISSVNAGGPGWSCTVSPTISCTRTAIGDTLAPSASFGAVTVTYSVASTVTAGTALTNSATVSGHTYDPSLPNNTDTAGSTVVTSADIGISKTASSTAMAGSPLTYQLAVNNLGPSVAAGPIAVSDPLPAGMKFVSAAGAGWTCDPIPVGTIGATLHCILTTAAAGTGQPVLGVGEVPTSIAVTVDVPSDQTAAFGNTASVSSPTSDPVPGNNSSTSTLTPAISADLLIEKRHLADPFVAGGVVHYQIDVRNLGPSDATGVTVHDTMPVGLTPLGATSSDPNWLCSQTSDPLTCVYTGTLAPSATPTSITLAVQLGSGFTGSVDNTATVSSTSTDPVPANNSSTDNSAVNSIADLSITKTHTDPVTAGDNVDFALAVTNNGPSDDAGTITVTDPLPVGLAYLGASGTGWTCVPPDAARLVDCSWTGGLVAGASTNPITVSTTVDAGVGPSSIVNIASVNSDIPDDDLSNNSASDPVTVLTSSSLSLTKQLTSASPAVAGSNAVFTLSAANAGPSDAVTVQVTDTLPAGLSFVSGTGTGWACAATGQAVVCARARIAAGSTAPDITLTTLISPSIPVTLPGGTTSVVNHATIDTSTSGPVSNPLPVTVPIQATADLALLKSPSAPTVLAGDLLTWTLAVSNTGPSDAAGDITVTDTLPAQQTYVSTSGSTVGWTCLSDPGLNTVTCTLAQVLAAGADAPPLQLLVRIDAAAPTGSETNDATATSPTPGAAGHDTSAVTVSRLAQLHITKTHTGHGSVGADLAFTLAVHNDGPSVADQVFVTDPLPTGLSYVSATGTGWTCALGTGTAAESIRCDLAGVLAAGADSTPITVTTTVDAAAYPQVTNVATVATDDPGLPGTATAVDSLDVDPDASLAITKQHLGSFAVGHDSHYRITVANHGPTATPGPITVLDELPAGLSYVSVAGAAWNCAATGQHVSCQSADGLAVGADSAFSLTVSLGAAAFPTVTNTATASAPGSADVSATDIAPVRPLAQLVVSKVVASYADGVAVYKITVRNSGPNPTLDPIVVTDALPAGLSYVSAAGDGWLCSESANTVACVRTAALGVAATSAVSVSAAVSGPAGSTITNIAMASTGGQTPTSSTDVPSNPAVLTVQVDGAGAAAGGGALPQTGVDARYPIELAAGILLIGFGLMLMSRRRAAR